MEFTLKLNKHGTAYCFPHSGGLCFNGMNDLFDLDDKPKVIDVIVSKRPAKNSYFVKKELLSCGLLYGVEILLSDGDYQSTATNNSTDKYLEPLPKKFYVSVIA